VLTKCWPLLSGIANRNAPTDVPSVANDALHEMQNGRLAGTLLRQCATACCSSGGAK
jgi:hypothetical protein